MRALVRPPGKSLADASLPTLDAALARRQHAAYRQALREAGLAVDELPPAEDRLDACFVRNAALIFGTLAVMARFDPERHDHQQEAVRDALKTYRRPVEIRAPGTFSGGDVLVIGPRVFVGLSARTNRAGFAQLRDLLELEGAAVEALDVPGSGQLLSACSYLGHGVLLATDAFAGNPAFAGLDVICVPPDEAYAASAQGAGDHAILPAGYPRTADLVRERGFEVLPMPLTEFAGSGAGASCLSLLFE